LLRSFIELPTHKHFYNFREKNEIGEALKQKETEIKELTSKRLWSLFNGPKRYNKS
jgi:hypothetical protein